VKQFFVRFFTICISLVLIGWFGWVWGMSFLQKNSPYKDEIIVLTSSVIDDSEGIFLVAHIGSEVPNQMLLTLPGNSKALLPDDYGAYELRAVLPLLDLDKRTEQYKRAVFSRILGVPVSDFLVIHESIGAADFAQLRRVLKQAAFKKFISFTMPWQEVALLPLLQNPPADVQMSSLEETQSRLQKSLVRAVTRSELSCTLAIVNTTEESGLARQLATVVERSGVRVVRITDASQLQEHSQLMTDPSRSECNWIIPLVRSWFFTDLIEEESSDAQLEYRAWGVVFIGADAH